MAHYPYTRNPATNTSIQPSTATSSADFIAVSFRSERASLALQAVQLGDPRRVHRIELAPEQRLDQRVLGAEVVVHGREVHAGARREQAHGGAFEAVQHEQLLGGIENAGAGFVLRLHGAEGHDGRLFEIGISSLDIQTNV